MSSSDSLESSKLTPTLVALQQGPRPLPFFLQMAQHETTGDAARLAHILAGLRAFQAAARPPAPPDVPGVASAGRARLLDFGGKGPAAVRAEEHTSELQSLMRITYAVFCLK